MFFKKIIHRLTDVLVVSVSMIPFHERQIFGLVIDLIDPAQFLEGFTGPFDAEKVPGSGHDQSGFGCAGQEELGVIYPAGDTAVKILLTILSADRLEEPAKIGDITGWRGCFDTIIVSSDIGGLCSSAGEPVHADAIRIHFRTAYEVIDRPNPIPNKILSHIFTDQAGLSHGIGVFFCGTSYF